MRRLRNLKDPPCLSRARIERISGELRHAFPRYGVRLAYIFGSYGRFMRGEEPTPGRLSDLDVAVLLSGGGDHESRGLSSGLGSRGGVWDELLLHRDLCQAFKRDDIELVVLDKASPLLRDRVIRTGWVLYCEDELLRIRFAVDALREYLDTKPLRILSRKYLFERIGGKGSATGYGVHRQETPQA